MPPDEKFVMYNFLTESGYIVIVWLATYKHRLQAVLMNVSRILKRIDLLELLNRVIVELVVLALVSISLALYKLI